MSVLTPDQRDLLAAARTATLATIDSQGRPRLVPCCFAVHPEDGPGGLILYTPLDEKPKHAADVREMARVRDILARSDVGLLVDRWDEDWSRLAWLRLYGTGEFLEPRPTGGAEHAEAIAWLRAKYPQYQAHALESRPIIRIQIDRVVAWSATDQGVVLPSGR